MGKKLGFTYDQMAAAIENKLDPLHKMLKKLRADIKTVTFGVPYGAGAKRVAAMTGMSEEEAQKFIDQYFERFPVLKQWLETQGNMAIQYGFTATPYGRKRFYVIPPSTDPDYDSLLSQIRRWAGNHPIQAANADMLKDALRKIYSAMRGGVLNGPCLYDGHLLLVVHDEIVMLVKEEDAEAVQKIMYDAMTEAYNNIIPDIWNKIVVVIDDIWEKQ
jgi:DNA polymerase-1